MAGLPVRVTTTPNIGLVQFWYGWLIGKFYAFNYIAEVPGVLSTEMLIQEFARSHGVLVGDEHPRLNNDPVTITRVNALLEQHISTKGSNQIIIIHPGPSSPVKEWPASAWTALVEKLRELGYETIIQVGVNKHLNFQAAQAAFVPGIISLVDKLSLEETIALISRANLFIGIDSGLLHIAASVQTPAVGIWGPTSPLLYFSSADAHAFVTSQIACQGCQHRYPRLHWVTGCPHDIACMNRIPVEAVLQACLATLKLGRS
jgi:ADP-heptose:LPS heptosyltransferase